jgi:hypothetical protein
MRAASQTMAKLSPAVTLSAPRVCESKASIDYLLTVTTRVWVR